MSSSTPNSTASKYDPVDASLQALPPIDINEVIGVCEIVQEHGGRVDLYDLVRELGDLKLIVPAVEGARLLGFVKIRNGGSRQRMPLRRSGRSSIGEPSHRFSSTSRSAKL